MNTVQLIGRLTSDPMVTELDTDYVVAKFNIAIDRVMSSEKRERLIEEGKTVANFPRIQAWGKQARLTPIQPRISILKPASDVDSQSLVGIPFHVSEQGNTFLMQRKSRRLPLRNTG